MKVGIQLTKLCFKIEQHVISLKSAANSIDMIAATQLASATLIKLFSYFCQVMLQPVDNQ